MKYPTGLVIWLYQPIAGIHPSGDITVSYGLHPTYDAWSGHIQVQMRWGEHRLLHVGQFSASCGVAAIPQEGK